MAIARDELLIQPAELAERLGDPALRILDATVHLKAGDRGYEIGSGHESYLEAHVPGAAFMDQPADFSDTASPLAFTLPAVDALAAAIGALGVAREHEVVVYAASHTMWATRAWWLLRHAGHDRVRVLDGGLPHWRASGHATRAGEERYAPTRFDPRPRPEFFVGLADVDAARNDPQTCTLNALPTPLYEGTGPRHYGRPGHIPGSLSLPYDELLEGGRFRQTAELEQALRARGVLDADRVITYCGGGISATIDGFACLLCGQDRVAVYDGSMAEWLRDASRPLTTGSEP